MTDKSVTWDPEFDSNGPTCDIPTTDDPLSDDNSDDDYPYVAERSPAATASEPNRDCKVSLVHQPLPGGSWVGLWLVNLTHSQSN